MLYLGAAESKPRLRRNSGVGYDGLANEPRTGAPRKVTDDLTTEVVAKARASRPPTGYRWTTRSLAQATALSQTEHRQNAYCPHCMSHSSAMWRTSLALIAQGRG